MKSFNTTLRTYTGNKAHYIQEQRPDDFLGLDIPSPMLRRLLSPCKEGKLPSELAFLEPFRRMAALNLMVTLDSETLSVVDFSHASRTGLFSCLMESSTQPKSKIILKTLFSENTLRTYLFGVLSGRKECSFLLPLEEIYLERAKTVARDSTDLFLIWHYERASYTVESERRKCSFAEFRSSSAALLTEWLYFILNTLSSYRPYRSLQSVH